MDMQKHELFVFVMYFFGLFTFVLFLMAFLIGKNTDEANKTQEKIERSFDRVRAISINIIASILTIFIATITDDETRNIFINNFIFEEVDIFSPKNISTFILWICILLLAGSFIAALKRSPQATAIMIKKSFHDLAICFIAIGLVAGLTLTDTWSLIVATVLCIVGIVVTIFTSE